MSTHVSTRRSLLRAGAVATPTPPTFKVGSFRKVTAAGLQAITDVGFQPKVLILWTAGGLTLGTFRTSYYHAIGFASGPSNVYSSAHAFQDAVNPSNASRRSAAKALTIVQWGEVVESECDLVSFDVDGFTLNWTTSGADAFIVHYIAAAGDVQAKVTNNIVPATGITGNQAYTGAGFQPQCLLTLESLSEPAAGGQTIPYAKPIGGLRLAAATSSSARWAVGIHTTDGTVPGSTFTRRVQRSNKILAVNTSIYIVLADLVSLDADGFTVNYTTNGNGSGSFGALALRGLQFKVGVLTKATATGLQAVTGVGFKPALVVLASAMMATDDAISNPLTQHARMTLGAATAFANGCAAIQAAHNVVSSDGISKGNRAYVKFDNDTTTIEAEAYVARMDPDGFALNWTVNDGTTHDIPYLAMAAL